MNALEKNNFNFIDLFAGCGGLSLGLLNSGWNGIFAIEKNEDAFRTFKSNLITLKNPLSGEYSFRDWPNWLEPEAWDIVRFLKKHSNYLKKSPKKIDLLAGGPPCQGFSFAGKRNEDDPRNQLFKQYIKVVELLNPKIILLENVKGMSVPFNDKNSKKTNGKSFAGCLKDDLEKLSVNSGYHIYQQVIHAEDFGVPQFRPRLFTVGFSKELFKKPPDIFSELYKLRKEFLEGKGLPSKESVTVGQALSDIDLSKKVRPCDDPDSPPGFKEIIYDPSVNGMSAYQILMRNGLDKNYQPNSLRLVNHKKKTINRFKQILDNCRKGVQLSHQEKSALQKKGVHISKKRVIVPLSSERPSHTITTIPDDLLHYRQPRVHTVREYARIQSFPDWFKFKGKYTTGGKSRKKECPRYTQVGNAVPPLLAEVFGVVLKHLLHERILEVQRI